MFHSKLRQAVTTTVAALAVLALAAPAAEARKPLEPPADLIVQPIKPYQEIGPIPCVCLPPVDVA
jgi:hypothetical protein